MQFHPWVGKILWRRAWQPTPVFLPAESHGQRSMAGYGPWGCKESDTTEVTECTHTNNQGLASWQKPSRLECIRLLGEIQAQTCSAQTLELCDNILFFFFLSLSRLQSLNFFGHRLLFLHLSILYSPFSIISTFSFHFLPGCRIVFLHRFGIF